MIPDSRGASLHHSGVQLHWLQWCGLANACSEVLVREACSYSLVYQYVDDESLVVCRGVLLVLNSLLRRRESLKHCDVLLRAFLEDS